MNAGGFATGSALTAGVLAILLGTCTHAQDAPGPHTLSFGSPILWTFKWISIDYERKISRTATVGVSMSHRQFPAATYDAGSFHVGYWPGRAALTGLYIAAATGIHRAGQVNAPGGGIDVGYVWRAGPNQNIVLTVGYGGTVMLRPVGGIVTNLRLFDVGIRF